MAYLKLEELSAADIERLARRMPVVFFAAGSFEQHGPHLPLATDAIIARAVTRELARLAGGILAPPIPYNWIGGTRAFPAGINPRSESVIGYAASIMRDLHRRGLRALAVVNCHGGAIATYDLLQRRLSGEGIRLLVIYAPRYFSRGKAAKYLAGLAAEATSCMGALALLGRREELRALRRELSRAVALYGEEPPPVEPPELPLVRRWAEVGFDYTHECQHVTPSSRVSEAKGKAFIRALARELLPVVEEYRRELEEQT